MQNQNVSLLPAVGIQYLHRRQRTDVCHMLLMVTEMENRRNVFVSFFQTLEKNQPILLRLPANAERDETIKTVTFWFWLIQATQRDESKAAALIAAFLW